MQLGDSLRTLADLVDDIEASGVDVVDARPDGAAEDGGSFAELRVRVPAEDDQDEATVLATDGFRPAATREAAPDEDTASEATDEPGRSQAEHADRADDTSDDAAGTESEDAEARTDGDDETDVEPGSPDRVGCTRGGCEATFDTEHGMRIHRSKAHGPAGPDYDPEELRTVYDRHDSFESMRDALGVDVSAQTVRRWMMDRGIHTIDEHEDGSEESNDESAAAEQAGGNEGGGETDEETGTASRDEVRSEDDGESESGETGRFPDLDEEMPDGVTTEALCAAVEEADTLYDVQTCLDLERETARDVLSEFDLLELVHGRVADQDRRKELKDEIDVRIQANASTADSRSD